MHFKGAYFYAGASKGTLGDTQCVTEIILDKNKEVRGRKCFKTHHLPKFSRGDTPGPLLKRKRAE